jgi:putative inorganic carbon (hco3(-)) transporter
MSDTNGVTHASLPLARAHGAAGQRWLPYLAIAATVLALSCAMVTVTGTIAEQDAGSSLKLYHCVLALVALGLAVRGRLARMRIEMIVYFVVTLSCSFLAAFAFGVETRPIVVAVVMIYASVSGATLGTMIGRDRAMSALRIASTLFIIAVIAKAVVNLQAFITFFANPQGHPILPTFSVGGANLEASWVSLAAVFFIGSAWFLPYCAAALAISLLYASRVAVIIVALALVLATVRSLAAGTRGERRRMSAVRVFGVLGVIAALSTVAIAQYGDGLSYVVKRFQSIGDEPGSLGRMTLWRGGADVFVRHPLGVGQGNALPALEHEIGANVPENNLHNLYLQHLVETGLPGFAVYLLFGVVTWRRFAIGRYQDPLLAYVLCYMTISAIQFSGGDPLLWFVWGLQSGLPSGPAAGARA